MKGWKRVWVREVRTMSRVRGVGSGAGGHWGWRGWMDGWWWDIIVVVEEEEEM